MPRAYLVDFTSIDPPGCWHGEVIAWNSKQAIALGAQQAAAAGVVITLSTTCITRIAS